MTGRRIEQVVMNLAVNARDAMPEGGTPTIETRQAEVEEGADPRPPAGILTVRDEGEGLDPSVQSHIFEPFFTTKPAGAGTGLGLSSAVRRRWS